MNKPSTVAARAPASGLSLSLGLFGDERLARLVGKGNERAFATIYERYHQRLYRYCSAILHDEQDAQDALQSTLVQGFAALRRGQREAPLRPWLFRIAHNEAVSIARRRRGAVELTQPREPGGPSAEEQAGERARLALLIADLQALPERQRGALVMRELSGLSNKEIAIALGTSVGAARQSVFEARQALLEFGEGRSMSCEDVRRTVSQGDGRALRGRRVRAHLRDCSACAAFAAAIPTRQADLRALASPLPPILAAGMLARLGAIGSGQGAGGAGGLAVGVGGKTVGATVAAKALTGAVIVVTAAGVTGGLTLATHDRHRPAVTRPARTTLPVGAPGGVRGGSGTPVPRSHAGANADAQGARAPSAISDAQRSSSGQAAARRRAAGVAHSGVQRRLTARGHRVEAHGRTKAGARRRAVRPGVGGRSRGKPTSAPAGQPSTASAGVGSSASGSKSGNAHAGDQPAASGTTSTPAADTPSTRPSEPPSAPIGTRP